MSLTVGGRSTLFDASRPCDKLQGPLSTASEVRSGARDSREAGIYVISRDKVEAIATENDETMEMLVYFNEWKSHEYCMTVLFTAFHRTTESPAS